MLIQPCKHSTLNSPMNNSKLLLPITGKCIILERTQGTLLPYQHIWYFWTRCHDFRYCGTDEFFLFQSSNITSYYLNWSTVLWSMQVMFMYIPIKLLPTSIASRCGVRAHRMAVVGGSMVKTWLLPATESGRSLCFFISFDERWLWYQMIGECCSQKK